MEQKCECIYNVSLSVFLKKIVLCNWLILCNNFYQFIMNLRQNKTKEI